MLETRRGNLCAIAPPHQHAILGLAQIRNAHGKPYSDRRQRDGKSEGRDVRQHALAKIVRFIPVSLIARQIVRFLPGLLRLGLLAQLAPPTGRVSQGARPEFEHAMLFFRGSGPLGLHWCQLRDILMLFSTLARRLPDDVDMARMRQSTPQRSHGTCRKSILSRPSSEVPRMSRPPSRTTRDFGARSFWLVTIFFGSRETLAGHLIACAVMA